ncbi:unnamed protein product [Caenorhabditis sp. 36 PRJEB53466]|nr:unnamed protein product [Caenorhabditis sp. 36 PRJEB53466]
MSSEREASITLKNESDRYFMLRVMYMFPGQEKLTSKWVMLRPHEEQKVFEEIVYYTGALTKDEFCEFKLQGIKYKEVRDVEPLSFVYDGKHLILDDIHFMNNNAWIRHDLADNDNGMAVTVCAGLPNARIVSASSSTTHVFTIASWQG